MSTLYVAIVIILITVIPTYLFVRLSKRQQRKEREARFRLFEDAGNKHQLQFTKHEELKSKWLGFDATQKKLFVYLLAPAESSYVLDMATVQACTVEKRYLTLGTPKGSTTEKIVHQIGLQLTKGNGTATEWITFYDNGENNVYEMEELEQKAKAWETVLQKHTVRRQLRRA